MHFKRSALYFLLSTFFLLYLVKILNSTHMILKTGKKTTYPFLTSFKEKQTLNISSYDSKIHISLGN